MNQEYSIEIPRNYIDGSIIYLKNSSSISLKKYLYVNGVVIANSTLNKKGIAIAKVNPELNWPKKVKLKSNELEGRGTDIIIKFKDEFKINNPSYEFKDLYFFPPLRDAVFVDYSLAFMILISIFFIILFFKKEKIQHRIKIRGIFLEINEAITTRNKMRIYKCLKNNPQIVISDKKLLLLDQYVKENCFRVDSDLVFYNECRGIIS